MKIEYSVSCGDCGELLAVRDYTEQEVIDVLLPVVRDHDCRTYSSSTYAERSARRREEQDKFWASKATEKQSGG